jgi:hypothetical protein
LTYPGGDLPSIVRNSTGNNLAAADRRAGTCEAMSANMPTDVNTTVLDLEIERPDGLTYVNAVANLSNP